MAFIETPVYLIFVLSIVLFLSEWASRKPRLKAFGIALLVLVLGAVFSNVGLLPSRANPTYDFIFEYVAPASLFLMLLDVNLTQLKKTGLPILILFLLGSLGTVLGVFIATLVIKDGPLFEGLYPALAGMLAGTYTGGSINFNAVALHYRVMDQGLVYTSAVAADNVVTTLWFFVTIAVPVFLGRWFPLKKLKTRNADTGDSHEEGQIEIVEDDSARLNIQSLSRTDGGTFIAQNQRNNHPRTLAKSQKTYRYKKANTSVLHVLNSHSTSSEWDCTDVLVWTFS